jgi:hypothetical protein
MGTVLRLAKPGQESAMIAAAFLIQSTEPKPVTRQVAACTRFTEKESSGAADA